MEFFEKIRCLIETSKLLLNIVEKSRFALPKVIRQQFTGEVGTFITDVDFFQDAVYQKIYLNRLIFTARRYA